MATVTKPLITNETGLAIVEAIENLNMSGVKFAFVSTLPATGEEGTFYFVSNGSPTGSNLYDEYIWDKTNSRFELISSNIQIDSTPTQGSSNPVASGGVYTALTNKVDKVTGKGLSTNDYDTTAKNKLDGLANIKSISTGLNLDSSTGTLTANGVPTGGITGQMLIKNSSTDSDASWQSLDTTPTQNSTKPATSGGIFTALSNKATVTTTTTDPGEGSPLATNNLLIVVEE